MKRLYLFIAIFVMLVTFAYILLYFNSAPTVMRKAEPGPSAIPTVRKQARVKKCKCCKISPELRAIVQKHLKRGPAVSK